jgi:Leucine-rich repeat (LRR) protein
VFYYSGATSFRLFDTARHDTARHGQCLLNNLSPLLSTYSLSTDLANNKLKTIQGLKGLSNLRKIDLGANRIRVMDEEELSGLVSLEELWLGKNKIEKITGLEKLTKLRRLDLQSNRLEVVENLTSQVETLEEIYLAHNGITTEGASHPTGLAQAFQVLNVVDLGRNRLTSANTFAHILTLDELWLSGNKIATFDDIMELSALTNLDTIYLEYNPLQDNNPLYRKRIHEIMPCLKQIDANMIAPLPRSMYATSAGATGTGTTTRRAETDEAQLRRMQDMAITRAKEELEQSK